MLNSTKTQKIKILLLMLCTSLSIYSCKDDRNAEYQFTNQEFVERAASSNKFEIEAGKLALSKGVRAEVKEYGEHMVMDHGMATTELKTIAGGKGLFVPEQLMEKEQTNLNALAQLSGTAFDKEFARMMVVSHQETISLFETAAGPDGVPDTDLRTMASNKLPTLRSHLTEAMTLQTMVNQ